MSNNVPWVPADQYGRSLSGFSVNLLVSDMDAALHFQTTVLQAVVVFRDARFAVLQGYGGEWMLHRDDTYRNHPMGAQVSENIRRGAGVELRLHGCDPDQAEAAARKSGYQVLSPATDKPHGLREVYILDRDGYTWVPDIHTADVG